LVEDVKLRVRGDAEAHLVAFAFLVVFAHEAAEGSAAFVLVEAGVVVVVKDQLAGEGSSPSAGRMQPMVRVLAAFLLRKATRSAGRERRRATTMSRVIPCLKLWGRPRTRARHRVRRE
jgi:hypothetical protein